MVGTVSTLEEAMGSPSHERRSRRTVLVPTDGSPASLRILPHAGTFANRSGATLRLVYILTPEVRASSPAFELARQAGIPDATVYNRGRSESLGQAIARVASELNADLIAMHSEHAHSAIHHAVSGSVTLDVLARTHLPLLVSGPSIDETVHDSPRFVVATDGTAESDRALLRQANWLRERSFKATLLEVYLPRLGDESEGEETRIAADRLNRLKQSLAGRDETGIAVENAPSSRQMESRIVEKALEIDAFGIAVSTAAHHRLRHLLLGSISMVLLQRSPLPLLLTPR